MSTAQHSIIPLAALAHAAMEATNYRPDGSIVILRSSDTGLTDISHHSFAHIVTDLSDHVHRPETVVALIFPGGHELDAPILSDLAQTVSALGQGVRDAGGTWDTVIGYGGVRFRIYSEHGWLDEPETDVMRNDDLDLLISRFSGPRKRQGSVLFDSDNIGQAQQQWRHALASQLSGTDAPSPLAGSLRAGPVRDAVIVWAVGEEGHDSIDPGQPFVPPMTAPNPKRIRAAYELLADRRPEIDGVHALACGSYLAWWSGHRRLATHLYYRARSTGQRSRLASLVWTALMQDIPPKWMR